MTDKKRSNAQNRYRFGVIVKAYRDKINGEITKANEKTRIQLPMLSVKDIDFFIKDKAWRMVDRFLVAGGLQVTRVEPLRFSSTKEFEEKMEEARAYAAMNLGLEIPLPNEADLEVYEDNLNREG